MKLTEIAHEIFMLNIHVPIDVENVNLYIFRGDVPTMIDTGTKNKQAYQQIREALNYLGIKTLEQVIATHWHVDHAGGTQNFAQEGSQILIGARDYEEWSNFVSGKALDTFERCSEQEWGVPRDIASKMIRIYDNLLKLTYMPENTQKIQDQQLLTAGNTTIKAIHTPGHTAGHLSFYDEKNGMFFSGDMLLPDQIPYPGVWVENGQFVSGLPSYMNSLDLIEKIAPKQYFPSHGLPQADASARCQRVRAQIMRQTERFPSKPTIYEGALQLAKEKVDLGILFVQLHYVYGWEALKNQIASQTVSLHKSIAK